MSFGAWEEHADSVNKKLHNYDECSWHLVPLTCNHFTKRGPKSFLLKSIKIKKIHRIIHCRSGIQYAHYSKSKIKMSQLNLPLLSYTYQLWVFGLMSSMMAWTTSRVVACPPRSGVWTCEKNRSTIAFNFKGNSYSSLPNYIKSTTCIFLTSLSLTRIMQIKTLRLLWFMLAGMFTNYQLDLP